MNDTLITCLLKYSIFSQLFLQKSLIKLKWFVAGLFSKSHLLTLKSHKAPLFQKPCKTNNEIKLYFMLTQESLSINPLYKY